MENDLPVHKPAVRPGGLPDRRHGRDEDYCGPERRRALLDSDDGSIKSRLDRGSQRMRALEGSVTELREEVAANTATTEEVREILAAVKTGIRVLGWIGTGAMWVVRFGGAVATAAVAIYGAWYAITHGGALPPPPTKH